MKTRIILDPCRLINNMVVFWVAVFLMLFVASKGFSQDNVSQEPNSAMKKVFKELKAEDSSTGTFMMIGGIIAIVGVAMYMSFKGGNTSPKPRLKGQ